MVFLPGESPNYLWSIKFYSPCISNFSFAFSFLIFSFLTDTRLSTPSLWISLFSLPISLATTTEKIQNEEKRKKNVRPKEKQRDFPRRKFKTRSTGKRVEAHGWIKQTNLEEKSRKRRELEKERREEAGNRVKIRLMQQRGHQRIGPEGRKPVTSYEGAPKSQGND